MVAPPAISNSRRPFGLRLILLETTVLSLRAWGRIWVVFDQRERYQEFQAAPPVALYIAANLIWGILFALMVFGIWQRRQWINRWLWIIFLGFGLFSLGWFRVFAQSIYDRDRFPFLLIITGLGVAINIWLIHRPQFRTAFRTALVSTQNNLEK